MTEYDVMTVADDLLMRDSLERLSRTFALKLTVDQVQALEDPNHVLSIQASLWQMRDRKQGYPLEDYITLKIKQFAPQKTPPNINSKILGAWWGTP